jgi:tetratricopeptide (TPR) repeat protein
MRKIYVVAGLLCAAALLTACAKKVGDEIKWYTTMEEGKELASAENKTLIAYYSADWSKMSEAFEDDVLANVEVEKKLADLVAVHIDSDVDEDTPKSYAVTAYPTAIFYTPRGEEITRVVGLVPAQEFLQLLDDIAAGRVETLNELLAREEANPEDLKLAYEVGTMYVETGRPERALARFDKILTEDVANESGLRPGALTNRGFIELVAQQPEPALAYFEEVLENYAAAPEARKCYLYRGDAYHLMDDVDEAIVSYKTVVSRYPDTPEAEEAQAKLTKLTMLEETVEAFTQGPETADSE